MPLLYFAEKDVLEKDGCSEQIASDAALGDSGGHFVDGRLLVVTSHVEPSIIKVIL